MSQPIALQELTARLRALRDALLTGLVERDLAIRLALLSALSGEHLLLIGPPGTAKSLIARRLKLAFTDATCFERLLTRFTVPEELFGPLSIRGLEDDRYERLIDGYLPTASIAFLDEIFKANSAILNALLTLLNEREFDNGTQRVATPLIAAIGASNELPEGAELAALYDRFLLRLHVGPVSKAGFTDLLRLRGEATPEVPDALRLSAEDLARIKDATVLVEVPTEVEALLHDLRDWCAAEDIPVSDRRWRKIVRLLQVSALTSGRLRVSVWDAWLLQHMLWEAPEDREKVQAWYAARVGASGGMDASRLTRIVVSWEGKLQADRDSRSQRQDTQGRPLFQGPDGEPTTEGRGRVQRTRQDEPLFLAPEHATGVGRMAQHRIQDRSNGGAGLTLAELNRCQVLDQGNFGWRQFAHWSQAASYLNDPANWLSEEVDLPPLVEPTRHKSAYIERCAQELDTLHDELSAYQAQLRRHVASLQREIRTHLWVTDDFIGPASTSLAQTRREVDALLGRLEALHKGYETLPAEQPRLSPP